MSIWRRLFGRSEAEEDPEEVQASRAVPLPSWVDRDAREGFVKVRLFLSPVGGTPSLYELDLPEDGAPRGGLMKCFSPPPEAGGGHDPQAPRRAWTVELEAEEVEGIQELAAAVRLFPVGKAAPAAEAATVELSFASGQAEARLRWWMSPPGEWTDVDRLVGRLRELATSTAREA